MKKYFFGAIVFACLGLLIFAAIKPADHREVQASTIPQAISSGQNLSKIKATLDFGRLPLTFIPNRGQMDSRVAYYVQGKDKALYFTPEGITIALTKIAQTKEKGRGGDSRQSIWEIGKEGPLNEPQEAERYVVKLDFVGANKVKPAGEGETGAIVSYFRGKPEEWRAGLATCSRIVYRDLWPGIDLIYYGNVNRLKYEFVVHPGADPSQIKLSYRGASSLSINQEGQLEVETPLGGFADDTPLAYQKIDGNERTVALSYKLDGRTSKTTEGGDNAWRTTSVLKGEEEGREFHVYGFDVGDYDRTHPLVLDPVVLIYCGYIGGSGVDGGSKIAVDASGNAYVTGNTASTEADFPTAAGPDLSYNGGYFDAYVAKINAMGTALVYCGYIGGSDSDGGDDIAVDSSGNAYIKGNTKSTEATFPVTVGPDLSHNGGYDIFVAKINPSGTALVYCGYIGGSGNDYSGIAQWTGIAVDGSGNAYIAGATPSTEATFPVTVGPDLTQNGGTDAFVAKVNPAGTALVYCGYIGGLDFDDAKDLAIDSSGNAYVAGFTMSTEASFPVTVGPDLSYNGGSYDAFVAKVNSDGTALVYCGYIGGSDMDYCRAIAVDSLEMAFVAGGTSSTEATFPVVAGPGLTYKGANDAFIARVNPNGTALVYCGYIGGEGADVCYGLAVDTWHNAYVTGYTASTETTFPVTAGPDLTYNGGTYDAFVAEVNAEGSGFVYCGYIGGSSIDYGHGIAVDVSGNAYVTGDTSSTEADFPVSIGPDLTYNGGSWDTFVAKIAAFSKDDLLGTWSGQGVYYRNSDTGAWVKLGSAATMITAGDLDGDGIDDLIGIWPTQGGVWVKYSKTGGWSKLSSTADWIGVGDMNGDGRCDLLGTWVGQGVYYRNSISGAWVKMASPATKITAGDIDGDWTDDLIGIWPAQGGVWVKYSKTGGWSNLSSTADWIGSGDMNGDGRADFLGTWTGQGVYYRNSVGGAWVKMSSPATQIVAGQIDDDISEDLLGMWPSQGGVWVKYSKTGSWSKLSTTADWIGAGKMRQLGTLGGISELLAPVGGFALGPSYQGPFEDLSEAGPLGVAFKPAEERNTVVGVVLDKVKQRERRPGPGEPGFRCLQQANLMPRVDREQAKKEKRQSSTSQAKKRD